MLLLFRSGWIHTLFGVVFLSGAVALVEYGSDLPAVFSSLNRPTWWTPVLALWVIEGFLGHLGILILFTIVGTLAIPKHFLRWWFSSLSRIYGNMSIVRALSLGLMAALLIEPLLRLGLQPLLFRELEPISAIVALAGIVAIASWSPFTQFLAIATFFESLWFSYLYLDSNNPMVPVIAHGLSEFTLALIVWKMNRMGLTLHAPAKPEL